MLVLPEIISYRVVNNTTAIFPNNHTGFHLKFLLSRDQQKNLLRIPGRCQTVIMPKSDYELTEVVRNLET